MSAEGKSGARRQSTQSNTDQPEAAVGDAVQSDIIPTLLHMLTRDSTLTARFANSINGDIKTASAVSEIKPATTWLESLANNATQSQERNPASTHPLSNEAISARLMHDELPARELISPYSHWITPTDFALMVLDDAEDPPLEHVNRMRERGIPDEVLLLDLLAPTSIELGRRWEEDLSDFADVTVGVCRLHRILRSMHPTDQRRLDDLAHGGRIALAPVPGEQHSFGLLLVGELLFRGGWYTDVFIDPETAALPDIVSNSWYEVAGVSISCETRIEEARKLISEVRRASCNPNVIILAGGYLLETDPALGRTLGADQIVAPKDDVSAIVARYVPAQNRI